MQKYTLEEKNHLQKILSETEALYSPYACKNSQAVRQYPSARYDEEFARSQFAVDVDKIIHSSFFNRGSDKTQVFSFYRNDDITRRASHVQLVSRIARTIGRALRLNLDLIEAIAIGHDCGHTPFGHKGEFYLNELYRAHTGRYFNHNVHSVRVLQTVSGCNLTLQTLDGILCHCGEKVNERYEPAALSDFDTFYRTLEECYIQESAVKKLRPGTLEGCVVRISDMIAYLGKDRQDAARLGMQIEYDDSILGKNNMEILDSTVTDVIVNSIGKPYLSVSGDVYEAMVAMQRENNEKIYQCKEVSAQYERVVKPMMEKMYERFLNELKKGDENSLVYKNQLKHRIVGKSYYKHHSDELIAEFDDIVVDFIASMTDDYFLEAFQYLFPKDKLNKRVKFVEYFDKRFL